MLKQLELSGIHFDVGTDVRSYVTAKLARLDRYIPKHSRKSAHMEVRLREETFNSKNQYVCEVTLHLPHKVYIASEKGMTVFAAVDLSSSCIKHQIHKYKDEYTSGKQRRHLFARFRHRLLTSMPVASST